LRPAVSQSSGGNSSTRIPRTTLESTSTPFLGQRSTNTPARLPNNTAGSVKASMIAATQPLMEAPSG
jgi:hypothetical protein